mmetsp:Transcript_37815/g.88488  ORF Transcript_37815/g.88488 Transcript_37815/m.88488 type:complete len:234 (-) Transcript_37815:619-1320(-)
MQMSAIAAAVSVRSNGASATQQPPIGCAATLRSSCGATGSSVGKAQARRSWELPMPACLLNKVCRIMTALATTAVTIGEWGSLNVGLARSKNCAAHSCAGGSRCGMLPATTTSLTKPRWMSRRTRATFGRAARHVTAPRRRCGMTRSRTSCLRLGRGHARRRCGANRPFTFRLTRRARAQCRTALGDVSATRLHDLPQPLKTLTPTLRVVLAHASRQRHWPTRRRPCTTVSTA